MIRFLVALLAVLALSDSLRAAERETLGPSNRRAPVVISELMYHPLRFADGRNLEFIELFNSGIQPEDLAGWRLSGEVSFSFPTGAVINPGSFLVIAASPANLASHYGLTNVFGPYTNALANEGGTLRLRNRGGAIMAEVEYDDAPPWPITADGAGHSLVLARPSYGEGDPRAWAPSTVRGGSPGRAEPAYVASAFEEAVINEVGVITNVFGDPPFVEFFNRSGSPLTLNSSSPLFLTDDPATNKVRLGSSGLTSLSARTAVALSFSALGLTPQPGGGTLYLVDTAQNRVLDAVRVPAQSPQWAYGRFPSGSQRLQTVTPAPALTPPPPIDPGQRPVFRPEVIINEIMYHPISESAQDEYVELFNRNAQSPVNVSGWKFVAGIDFTFPSNTIIPPNGYLVVAKNTDRLRANYAGLNNVVGDFSGQLSDRGERLALARPEWAPVSSASHVDPVSNLVYVVMDEVTYGTGGAWGRWSDGGGASLELASPDGDNDFAGHWRDSAEPTNSPWTTVRQSGPLEWGETRSIANAVEVVLFGEGECLVDNVQVLLDGVDRVSNGTLNANATGWVFHGTHEMTTWQATGGVGNSGCLHVRASGHGDTTGNRVHVPLTTTLAAGQQVTVSAQVRHLRGNLDVLVRIRGNWLDAGATMAVAPGAYGSPGRTNSAAIAPATPAIYDVAHRPVVPNAVQPVLVTARFDGARTNVSFIPELLYRVEPATTYVVAPMNDGGTSGDQIAGDGVFTATIPGQPPGPVVAFRVRARYNSPAATNFFPSPQPLYPGDTFGRECLLRFGERRPTGSFATYRVWITQATHNRWSTRGAEHHAPLNTTFVYGDQRAVYTVDSSYAGAEFIYDTPTGIICGYNLGFPPDERVLGAKEMLLDWGQSDDAGQRENIAFWIADKLGLPYLHRRHVILMVNGILPTERPLTGYHPASAKVYWDAQEPNGDLTDEWFQGDGEGELYKLNHLVFGSDMANVFGFHLMRFIHFMDSAGQRHQSAYRWHWRRRGAERGASDLTSAFRVLDAVNSPDASYVPNVEALVNVDEFMRMFVFERVIGNLDSLGWDNGHNMYGYYSPSRGWHLLPYDCELSLATPTGGWYDTSPTKDLFAYTYDDGEYKGDHTLGRMKQTPAFLRMYWRGFRDAINGPLVTANFLPVMQRYHAALVANSVLAGNSVPVASPAVMQTYLETRREYIRGQLATVNASFAVTSPAPNATLNTNLVVFSGTAPIEVATIAVNGIPHSARWTSVTTWELILALPPGPQSLAFRALDSAGQPIPAMTATLNLQLNAPTAAPETNVVMNEIMYHSASANAEYLELHNRSATTAFDLSGWRLNGLDYAFPTGISIAPGGFVVVAADRLRFGQTYGFGVPVAGVFKGSFDQGGETITLLRPIGTNEVTVDTVTFEDDLPWPALADGAGPSLQLIHPSLDNNRVASWVAVTNALEFSGTNVLIPMNASWRYRDDGVDLGTTWSEFGFNDGSWPSGAALLCNEIDPLPAPKVTTLALGPTTYYFRRHFNFTGDVGTVMLKATTIIDDGAVIHLNGQEAFRLGGPPGPMSYGTFSDRSIGNATNEGPFDLSTTSLRQGDNVLAVEVHQRNSTSSDVVFGLALEAVWPVSGGGGLPFTPGAPNRVPTTNSALPQLWLNELQVVNVTGPVDGRGQREPWVELYNAGSASLDLSGFFVSNDPEKLTRWAFPKGTAIASGEFHLLWLDGDSADQSAAEWHANFRLTTNDSVLLLSRKTGSGLEVVDYLAFSGLPPDGAIARVPDGSSDRPRVLEFSSAGTSNSGVGPLPAIFINELMAANTLWLDPADGDADDWVELYNDSDRAVNLAGYSLTDRTSQSRKFVIPSGITIRAHDFLIAWADEEEGQAQISGDLHLNFKLSDEGEAVALYSPDGRLVDSHSFGEQAPNASLARWPDGPGGFTATTNATPGMHNKLNGSAPLPLAITAVIVPGVGVRILFPAGQRAAILCKGTLDEPSWSTVNGVRGYDAATDQEWVLDTTTQGTRQRFYRAVKAQ